MESVPAVPGSMWFLVQSGLGRSEQQRIGVHPLGVPLCSPVSVARSHHAGVHPAGVPLYGRAAACLSDYLARAGLDPSFRRSCLTRFRDPAGYLVHVGRGWTRASSPRRAPCRCATGRFSALRRPSPRCSCTRRCPELLLRAWAPGGVVDSGSSSDSSSPPAFAFWTVHPFGAAARGLDVGRPSCFLIRNRSGPPVLDPSSVHPGGVAARSIGKPQGGRCSGHLGLERRPHRGIRPARSSGPRGAL